MLTKIKEWIALELLTFMTYFIRDSKDIKYKDIRKYFKQLKEDTDEVKEEWEISRII